MNETKIKLFMDDQKNINAKNLTNSQDFTIFYADKTITAINIYQLLNYQLNSTYAIDSNIEEITDENDKTYFADVISLFTSIVTEINDMSIKDNIVEESSDDNPNLDDDYNNLEDDF